MLKFGIPLVFASISSWFFYSSDRIFLLHYKNATEIGLYSIGNSLSQPLALLNQAIIMSVPVLILSKYESDTSIEKEQTKTKINKYWKYYLFCAISIASFFSIFSVDIFHLVTAPAYIKGALVLPYLIFSSILMMSVELVCWGMQLREKSVYISINFAISALLNIGLNFYFIPAYGFIGAAQTTLLSSFIYFFLNYFTSQKLFYIKHEIVRIIIYFVLLLIISILFPYFELEYGIFIPVWLKLIVYVSMISTPILLRLLDIHLFKSLFFPKYKY